MSQSSPELPSGDPLKAILQQAELFVPESLSFGNDPRIRPEHDNDALTRLAFHTADLLEATQGQEPDSPTARQAGDAFQLLKQATQGMAWQQVNRYLEWGHDEVTAEIYDKVYDNLHQFRGESKFIGWFYTVARNHAINTYYARAREEPVPMSSDSEMVSYHTSLTEQSLYASPETRFDAVPEDMLDVLDVLRESSDIQYRIFLYWVDGNRTSEIADMLRAEGIDYSNNTVSKFLHDARQTVNEEVELRSLERRGLIPPLQPEVYRAGARKKALVTHWVNEGLGIWLDRHGLELREE